MNRYYLPIDSKCLAHYYAGACISPSCYITNRPHDIQNRFDEYLLLTRKLGTKDTNCCLEIVLTDDEKKSLVDINGEWFIYEYPIPVSRVSKILFSSKEQMNTTLTNIRMSTAFVPQRLGEVANFVDNPTTGLTLPEGIIPICHKKNIEQFDRMLGALALMNVSRESYMNYSDKFFETFAMFNSYIAEQLKRTKKKLNKSLSSYLDVTSPYREKIKLLEQPLTEELIAITAQQEKVSVEKNKITKVINLSSLKNWSYIFAFIYQYGVGSESKRKKIDSLIISNFKSDELQESPSPDSLALLYGYNRGYCVFNNAYGLDADSKLAVKFKMESKLDHYIIESVYQYIFHNIITNTPFDYIDAWCPSLKCAQHVKSTDYQILDMIVIGKKKATVFSHEYWIGFFQEFKSSFWDALKEIAGKDKVEYNIKVLINKIHQDLLEEWNEQSELEKAKYLEELANKERTIERLYLETKQLKEQFDCNATITQFAEKNNIPTIIENVNEQIKIGEHSIDDILLEYDEYLKLKLDDLKKKLKEQSILFSKSAKKDELAKLLVKAYCKHNT